MLSKDEIKNWLINRFNNYLTFKRNYLHDFTGL